MGKGSKQRRRQVSREEYESNWAAIFGKKKSNTTRQQQPTDRRQPRQASNPQS